MGAWHGRDRLVLAAASAAGAMFIAPQQLCRARYRTSVPKSCTERRGMSVRVEWGEPSLAPGIAAGDILSMMPALLDRGGE